MQAQLIEQMKALRLRGMASALEESLTALSGLPMRSTPARRCKEQHPLPSLRPVRLDYGFAVEGRDQTKKTAWNPWSVLDVDRWSTFEVD